MEPVIALVFGLAMVATGLWLGKVMRDRIMRSRRDLDETPLDDWIENYEEELP